MDLIRNFVIIAHIDHGKSTLADRLLEFTHTVETRKMRPQYLDRLDLERERGITIKMAPVRMSYILNSKSYILNLIDTPGHSDFSYEVSRALAAVEGAVLLVDASKGIQAQTLSNFRAAQKAGLKIIGAVNKVDLNPANLDKIISSLATLLNKSEKEILRLSGKTGEGVEELLEAIITQFPPPKESSHSIKVNNEAAAQALIFDSLYDDHKGILAFVRNLSGEIKAGEEVHLLGNGKKMKIKEVGYFVPEFLPSAGIKASEIGYIATGLKEPDFIKIGDTISNSPLVPILPGYREPGPVVFISFYPNGQTNFDDLKKGFSKLRLSDSALNYEPEANEALGRGLKVGFLGQLHFEITVSRLKDEFNLDFLTSFPSVAYRVRVGAKDYIIKQPRDFPDKPDRVYQPMISLEILTPPEYLSQVVNLKNIFDLEIKEVVNLSENVLIMGVMPLAELIRDFDDQLKSISAGFASFSYELAGEAEAQVEKLEIVVANDVVPALTRIVPKKDLDHEARTSVEKLKKLLPREQFTQAIQAKSGGRIIARETIAAMRKDVTGYLYGGDRSRKMKLWKKQKRGKEKLKSMAKVIVPVEVFREILKK